MAEREKILEVRDLNISFRTDSGIVNAIRGVNLDLYKGETIAIVGESGSGKSVTTKAIMGIMAGNGSMMVVLLTTLGQMKIQVKESQKTFVN